MTLLALSFEASATLKVTGMTLMPNHDVFTVKI